jgi:hypothetical protein
LGWKIVRKALDYTIEELERIVLERRKQREYVGNLTKNFSDRLFTAIQTAVVELRRRGLNELGEPRLIDHPAGGGRRALQVPIEDWGIIFVPLVGAARPNIRDEAQIGPISSAICGRIAVFMGNEARRSRSNDYSFARWFLVLWGYGWPRQGSTIEHRFTLLAYALLNSFVKDIFRDLAPAATTLGTRWTPANAPTSSACRAMRLRVSINGSLLPGTAQRTRQILKPRRGSKSPAGTLKLAVDFNRRRRHIFHILYKLRAFRSP